MTNPPTTTKPSAMETIKDKAAHLVDKVTGKHHEESHRDTAAHATNVSDPSHSGPPHTGAAAADTAVPHRTPIDRAAYQQQPVVSAGQGIPIPVTGSQYGDQAVDPNLIHPSVIPHDATTITASTEEFRSPTTTGEPPLHHPPSPPLQHASPVGPTGTTSAPTCSQNIPPTAAGVVPTAYGAERALQDDRRDRHDQKNNYKHNGGSGGIFHRDHDHNHDRDYDKNTTSATSAAIPSGTSASDNIPINTNNSTEPVDDRNIHQAEPVQSINNNSNSVPAMGAPGTTTAAGTHMPGAYTTTQESPPVPRQTNDPTQFLP
ncbi:hypothetical protein BGX28_005159 [Mortierella sp. GBA30]|nr:hypothetical protein BGX28_005159 [Mortierella sp. GBA30]